MDRETLKKILSDTIENEEVLTAIQDQKLPQIWDFLKSADFFKIATSNTKEVFDMTDVFNNLIILCWNADISLFNYFQSSIPSVFFNDSWIVFNSVKIPDYIRVIGQEAFHGSDVQEIIFGKKVIQINAMAFEGCEALKHVDLPKSLKGLETRAFAYCTRLESITIPASVKEVKIDVFIACPNLKTIVFDGTINQAKDLHLSDSIYLGLTHHRDQSDEVKLQCKDGVINLHAKREM